MKPLQFRILGTLVVGAFLLSLPSGSFLFSEIAADAIAPCSDLSGLPLVTKPTQRQLAVYAAGVVQHLTAGAIPCWMGTDWQTKAGVGLEDSVTNDESPTDLRLQSGSLRRLLSELRPPAQVVSETHSKHKNISDGSPDPRLTSVDYNPAAARGLLKLQKSGFKRQGIPPLPPGSVIVKTIWERADMSGSRCLNLPASTFAAATGAAGGAVSGQRAEQQRPYDVGDQLRKPFTSVLYPGWRWVGVSEDGTTQSCRPNSSAVPVQPLSTVYHTILPKDPYYLGYSRTGDLMGAACEGKCLLALLGVNLMVKAHDGPDWIWIALWWTGQYHEEYEYKDMAPNSPWRYYEIAVTDNERDPSAETPTVSPNPNILFNPFLEGTQPNGTVANCKTCHQYAAVNRKDRSASLTNCGTGPTLGGPPWPLPPPTPVVDTCGRFFNTKDDYLSHYLTTDSLWSLAAATQKTPGTTPPKVPAGNGKR